MQGADLHYLSELDELLIDAVPDTAMVVVEVGCTPGRLSAELEARVAGRTVFGVGTDGGDATDQDSACLDEVQIHDLTTGPSPVQPGSVDAVVLGGVLGRVADPGAVLRSVRDLLSSDGRVIAAVGNIGHHSVLRPLLRGDFMYQPQGLLDAAQLRFFSYATVFKLFLDAGYAPRLVATTVDPISEQLHRALTPALTHFRVDPGRARKHLNSQQFIIEGRPLPARPEGFAAPLTFACLVNDEAQLESNLLRSPIFARGTPHEILLFPGQNSAAAGLQAAVERAENDIVVLVHQDVYLPTGWDHAFRTSWDRARTEFGDIGVAGLFGARYRDGEPAKEVGRIVDRDRLVDRSTPLPARVDSLDEVLLAVPRGTPLVADPRLGFHLYGADLALQASERGLAVVALDALVLHNSLFAGLDAPFHASREAFLDKWAVMRPLRTNVGELDTLRPKPAFVPWHAQLPLDLAVAEQTIAEQEQQLDATRQQLRVARGRLRHIEATRVWRTRAMAARWARRFRLRLPRPRSDVGGPRGA